MRNDLRHASDASTRSWTTFASTSRLRPISAALTAWLVLAVALGASGPARAACAGSASSSVHTGVGTGVHSTVHGVSSCGTSNPTNTNKVATTGELTGVDPETHTSPHYVYVSGTKTNTTSNSHPPVHASADLHGNKLH
jgi:hypothetical protein